MASDPSWKCVVEEPVRLGCSLISARSAPPVIWPLAPMVKFTFWGPELLSGAGSVTDRSVRSALFRMVSESTVSTSCTSVSGFDRRLAAAMDICPVVDTVKP